MKRFSRLSVSLSWFVLVSCLASAAFAADRFRVSGTVKDATGGVVVGAVLDLVNARQTTVGSARTGADGRYTIVQVPPGQYLLAIRSPGFARQQAAVTVSSADVTLDVMLQIEGLLSEVTVTGQAGLVRDTQTITQPVTVVDADQVAERAKAVVAQVASEAVGVHLLRTSPTMAGIFVRGLTGNKVNVFVDGVRYSTSSARGGVNTFLDLIDPTNLDRVELLRGPNSAQYGSDAIGGSVQFLASAPRFLSSAGTPFQGTFATSFNSADQSGGTNLATSYAGSNFGLYANLAGRRINDVRTGGGIDSHASVTRFLGVTSNQLMSEHLPDTSFTQYGGMVKANWALTPDMHVVTFFQRSQQDGGKRYDQLLGGDGNLLADLRNLMLDFGYARFETLSAGWFDHFSVTYSFNAQREERVMQGGNGNPRGTITHEYEKTRIHGLQVSAGRRIGSRQTLTVGGDYYGERIAAPSIGVNPTTRAVTVRRGRVPDGATYTSGGAWFQDVAEVVPNRLNLVANVRVSAASYRSLAADSPIVGGKTFWPDDELKVANVAFRAGAVVVLRPNLTLSGNVSRGFRAPHMTDLGTLGLTGSGFQVGASGVEGMGGTVGSTAGADAVSTGIAVSQVRPETSLSYETGLHYRGKTLTTELSVFVNDIYDNITYQTLLLPAGAVGKSIGDQAITSQNANGAVVVAAYPNAPVLVRTNFGDARIYGIEHSLTWRVAPRWTVGTVFTYLHAADRTTGLPPNIEGGTPAPDGYLKVRYVGGNGRFWIEPYLHAAARQSRLSSLDLGDRRTGATRSRSSIKSFFQNGATARGWAGPGADGTLGTSDDVLLLTGETLTAIQNRILGQGVDSAPLWTSIPGYVTVSTRAGLRLGRQHEVLIDVENIGDVNYRGIAWGIDAPGRSFAVRYQARF
jgi:outer membrane receptor protein involved in Fe transport